jgi:hypothetical protein
MTVLAVGVILVGAFAKFDHWNNPVFTILQAVIFVGYFSKFVIAVFLLLDDVRRLFTWLYEQVAPETTFSHSRSRFLSNMAVMMGALPFTTLTYGILRNPYRYKVYRTTVKLDDLPAALDGLRIVQISDIHSGSFYLKDPVVRSVEMVNREQPDLVFFTGDLVNAKADEIEPYLDVFDKIESRYGVFSVFGNHDYGDYVRWPSPADKTRNLDSLASHHRQMGWVLLRNENRLLTISGEKIAVIGVENYSALPQFQKYGDLAKAYTGTEEASLRLLLSHDPTHWDAQVRRDFQDIHITFSGHTHGFQFGIEVPGFIRWSPSQYMYKKWAGLYQEGKQHLYVNRGLGFLGYPGRVGILPEITVMELRRKLT